MYYVLTYKIPQDEDGGYFDVQSGLTFDGVKSWSIGTPHRASLPNPIVIDIIPVEGYHGPLSEMYDGNLCLMSDHLVSSLKEASVDNLDCYPALLKNTVTGDTYRYQAVNIIGLIAAADLGKSTWESYDGKLLFDVGFERLELNEGATHGALMFRLAENTSTILIHKKVRDHLAAANFDTLRFLEPGNWVT